MRKRRRLKKLIKLEKENLQEKEGKLNVSKEQISQIIPSNLAQEISKKTSPLETKLQGNPQDNPKSAESISLNQGVLTQEVQLSNPSKNASREKEDIKMQDSPVQVKMDTGNIPKQELPHKIQNPPIEDIKSKPEEKKDEKLGSVWNTNNYHWEEKNLTPFSKACIKETLEKLTIALKNKSKAKLKVEKVKGDSSINIRKGKKCYLFDFAIDLKLQILSSVDDALFTEGSINIDQFDQSSNEYDMTITNGMRLVEEEDSNKRIKIEINKALKLVKEKIMSK